MHHYSYSMLRSQAFGFRNTYVYTIKVEVGNNPVLIPYEEKLTLLVKSRLPSCGEYEQATSMQGDYQKRRVVCVKELQALVVNGHATDHNQSLQLSQGRNLTKRVDSDPEVGDVEELQVHALLREKIDPSIGYSEAATQIEPLQRRTPDGYLGKPDVGDGQAPRHVEACEAGGGA